MIVSQHISIVTADTPTLVFAATDETELMLTPTGGAIWLGNSTVTDPSLGFAGSNGFPLPQLLTLTLHAGDSLYMASQTVPGGVYLLAVIGKPTTKVTL